MMEALTCLRLILSSAWPSSKPLVSSSDVEASSRFYTTSDLPVILNWKQPGGFTVLQKCCLCKSQYFPYFAQNKFASSLIPRLVLQQLVELLVEFGADPNLASSPLLAPVSSESKEPTILVPSQSPLRSLYDSSLPDTMRFLASLPSFVPNGQDLAEMRTEAVQNVDGFSMGVFEQVEESETREFIFAYIDDKFGKNLLSAMPSLPQDLVGLVSTYLFGVASLKFTRSLEESGGLFD
jgi:hypothetical protein